MLTARLAGPAGPLLRLWPALLVLAVPLPVLGQQEQLPRTLTARIDSIFAAYDRDGSPGYAIGVIRRGQLVFAKGYGRADLDNNIPITPRTVFHLASLAKQFTAAAVALLILDHKLSLETPIATYFPEVKKYGADLRLKHLLYFTSGLPDYMSLPRRMALPWFSSYYFTIDEAIATTLRADRLEFAPGTRWAYSNVNYMLLAKIVERVSGMSLARFLEQRVFGPLGMHDSQLNDDATLVVPRRATGYASRSDSTVRRQLGQVGIHVRDGPGYIRLVRNSPHYGGSGVFSTVEDLATWDANFETHAVGGPAFTVQMLQRVRFAHAKDNDAFGLVFGSFLGREMIWFSGGDLDASTFMARLPSEHLSVICLSNMPTGDAEGRAKEVLRLVLAPAGSGRQPAER